MAHPPSDLVPLVDISEPSDTSLATLDRACRDHGFFLLEGHGLDELIDATWDHSRRFFAADPAHKEGIRRTADQPLGWYDRELTKRRRDTKEVFDFLDPRSPRDPHPNRWPDGVDGFRSTLETFFDGFATLAERTVQLVHAALDLDPATAAAHTVSRASSTVRLNHYPVGDPVPTAERDGLAPLADVALGHHTDPGVLTLLLQDDTGGLQAESTEHGWIDVPPRAGTIVVNLGDTMQVWTNDRYRAAVHRVVPMTDRSRDSIPFFANPAHDGTIEPIPTLAGATPRYRPFTWREFMRGRADDNYTDLGVDDIQISRYAVGAP